MHGRARIARRGRPKLRLAAWRAVWGAQANNPVLTARYQRLTTRAENPLSHRQAQAALAAALLRWLHVIITQRVSWSEQSASGLSAELPTAA